MMPFLPDDSYISFRYADNLAKGHGITFNPGEQPVEGYSNFLWILLCSLFPRVGLDMPLWATRMGVFFGVLSLTVLWVILRRRSVHPLQPALPLLLFACSGPFILYSVSGLETPLFAFLLLASVACADYAFSTRKLVWFVMLSLSCTALSLARPEGIIALPVIAVCLLYAAKTKRREDPLAPSLIRPLLFAFIIFFAAMVLYTAWRLEWFREFFPTPSRSKGVIDHPVFQTWQRNRIFFFHGIFWAPFGYYYLALALLGLGGLFSRDSRVSSLPPEFASFVLAAVYMAVYVNFRDWMPGMRYHSVLVGLLTVPASLAQDSFFAEFCRRTHRRRGLLFALGGAALVIMSLWGVATIKKDATTLNKNTDASVVALGKWLRNAVPKRSLLAISDIGAAAYYSGLRTFDSNIESLTDLHIAKYGWSDDYFFSREPDVVVLVSTSPTEPRFLPKQAGLTNDPRFSDTYRLIGKVRQNYYGERSFWVYFRNTIQISPEKMRAFPKGIGTR